VVVWHCVIDIVCALCNFVAAYHTYCLFTDCCCDNKAYVYYMSCLVVWQRFISKGCVPCRCMAACHSFVVCTVL